QVRALFSLHWYDYSQIKESWGFKNFHLFLFLCPPECLVCSSIDKDVDCITWTLAHSSYTELTFANFITDGWTIVNGDQNKQQCMTIPTICGKGVCGQNTQMILNLQNLPAHAQMKVKLKYLRIGSWEWEDKFKTTVGGEVIWESPLTSLPKYLYGICDSTSEDVFINIDMTFPHHVKDSTAYILNNLDGPFTDESFGARDIQILIKRTICGDKVVELQEQCDDGNLLPFDGCFGCMFSCVEGCSVCQDMICLECFEGWTYLENEFSCQKQMGQEFSCNNYQIQSIDHCLQFNSVISQVCENDTFIANQLLCLTQCQTCIDNVCYKCQPGQNLILGQCQDLCGDQISPYTLEKCFCDLNCEECVDNICYSCKNNLKLLDNECISICGDLAIQESEDCDDGNDIEFDGCFYCRYSCPKGCVNCEKGKCLDLCLPGFNFINKVCSTTCGDSIIAGNEQCEDNNTQEYDGCYQCKFSCPLNCYECIDGICINCNIGYQLIENQCSNVCGDGILQVQEQCDDGNLDSGDGCSQTCQVEIDWICNQGYDCTFVKYPQLMCEFIEQKNQYQYARIKFSQRVQLLSDIDYQDVIELSIIDLNETDYNITIIEVQPPQYQVILDVEYILQIEIFTNQLQYPILTVKLTEYLYNDNLAPLVNMENYL
ncbi:unnamed protein product, partial (macronuclear) [Paramecium tetraurelia]